MATFEPDARDGHAAFASGHNMLLWAGRGCRSDVLETFSAFSLAWREAKSLRTNDAPEGLYGMAFACDSSGRLYSFGGREGGSDRLINSLFCLDTNSSTCRKITATDAPSPREESTMVYFNRQLIVHGGLTDDLRASSDLLIFHLDNKTWTTQATTGEKPPPLFAHTLTMTERQRAAMFGGYDGGRPHNDTYTLDMEKWHWSKDEIKGEKPAARFYHTALCIVGPHTAHHPLLMVKGGWDFNTVFSDVWVLDVTNGVWSQLSLPTAIIGRYGHSAVQFGTGPDFRLVIFFGGDSSSTVVQRISETTLLLLSRRKRSWVAVTAVRLQDLTSSQRDQIREALFALSDERAQQIIDKALKTSSVEMRNIISVLTGLMGAGKTCFLSRVFNQVPPSLYTSTGVAEQSCRGLFRHMGTMSSWELFSHQKILEYLAHLFHKDLPPADMARLAQEIASLDPAAGDAPLPLPAPPTTTPSSLTSTSTSDKASPKPAATTKESDTSHSMMRLVKAPQDSDSPSRLELIQMIDTGGQPEYMVNMPIFILFCHLVFVVFNLLFRVDDFPPMHYHEEGKAFERKLKSPFSNRQIIQKLASTLQAKRFSRKKGQCFRMVAVATHRDCVAEGELAARVKEYHQALKDILLPANDEELVCYSDEEILFVLNLKEPDSTDLAKLDLIRQKVSESEVGERVVTPGVFLIFEQELAEFAAERNEKHIVSLEDCLQVGTKLKMDADSVRSALIFFHRQFTFLYFRHVLPHLVFTKPQVPLDSINSIVQFSYKVESGDVKGVTKKLTSSLRDGIITEEILSHEQLSKCFVPGLYEPHHAIDLLCHTFTLAPLSCERQQKTGSSPAVQTKPSTPINREKREYLMMCLRQAIPDNDIPRYISEIAPLVVQFTKNCVPLSCFGRTISCLLALYDWKLTRADNGSPECLATNIVSLYKPHMTGQIVLVDVGHSLQIHIRASQDTDPAHFPDICFQVRETVLGAVEQVFEMLQLSGIETSPAFICPCPRKPHAHSASVYQFKSKWFLHCCVSEKDVGAAEKKHIMWLDTSVAETTKPSLPKLLQFKVPQKVGTRYSDFGIFLLNDEDGTQIQILENDCLGKCERIVRNILSHWLQGMGKPVTWKELIETLRDCDLNELADTIQEKTQ